MNIKVRPAILLGEIVLGVALVVSIMHAQTEIAMGCVVGIAAVLPKLVESEEVGEK